MAIDPGAAGHRLGAGDGDDPLDPRQPALSGRLSRHPVGGRHAACRREELTNATHLVIAESEHPLAGQHLTLAHLNGAESASPVVVNGAGNWCRPRRATAPSCG